MSDACPSCGSSLLPDQRYCLVCGQRRGDPRLPFMDAVVFMDAAKRSQPADAGAAAASSPPVDRRPFMSANASLVAGVATLVLAIGVGVLIGRTGDGGSGNAAAQAPQIIRVGEGGAATASTAKAGGGTASGGKGSKAKSATVRKAKEKTETGASGTTKAVEEVYEPAPGVKIAPPEQEIGGDCDPGVVGCNDQGEFEGNFFE